MANTKHSLFSALPVEIRQKIWAQAVTDFPQRLIDPEALSQKETNCCRQLQSGLEGLLQACSESRAAVLQRYKLWIDCVDPPSDQQSSTIHPRGLCKVYVDQERDIFATNYSGMCDRRAKDHVSKIPKQVRFRATYSRTWQIAIRNGNQYYKGEIAVMDKLNPESTKNLGFIARRMGNAITELWLEPTPENDVSDVDESQLYTRTFTSYESTDIIPIHDDMEAYRFWTNPV